MQVKKLFLLYLIISTFVFQASAIEYNFSKNNSKPKFKVLSLNCKNRIGCSGDIYVNPKYFNESDMKEIGRLLSKNFKDKKYIHLLIFDDMNLYDAIRSGLREVTNKNFDKRGEYRQDKKHNIKYLLFLEIPKQSESQVVIKLL